MPFPIPAGRTGECEAPAEPFAQAKAGTGMTGDMSEHRLASRPPEEGEFWQEARREPRTPGEGLVRISLTVIVRNEERNLPACLGSVAGVFDEVIVLDTGSTDRTRVGRKRGRKRGRS
jgi:hypothetical protein